MMGKTVLPLRYHRALLAEPAGRRKLATLEKRLCRDPSAVGRAPHVQIAARPAPRKRSGGVADDEASSP